jgi:hypothetical protein
MSCEQFTTQNERQHSTDIDIDEEACMLLACWLPSVGALPQLISAKKHVATIRKLVTWYEHVFAARDYCADPPIQGLDALVDELAIVAVAPNDHAELAKGRWAIRVAEELVSWRRCLRDEGAESVPSATATDRLELAIGAGRRHIVGGSTAAS